MMPFLAKITPNGMNNYQPRTVLVLGLSDGFWIVVAPSGDVELILASEVHLSTRIDIVPAAFANMIGQQRRG